MRGKDFKDKGSMSPRFCRWAGWILFSAGSILMIIDWRTDFALMWPGMFGSRIIIPGFALLVMDMLITRKLQTGALGATALMCAAVDDVMAWMLLAIAMTFASVSGSGAVLSTRFIWLAAYVSVMVFLVRPLGRWLAARRGNHPLSYELLGVILAVALASASVTDAIGVHPLFGAFLAGICFPRVPAWQQLLRDRLEVILSLVLLPPVLCHHGSGNAIFSVVQRRGCGLG